MYQVWVITSLKVLFVLLTNCNRYYNLNTCSLSISNKAAYFLFGTTRQTRGYQFCTRKDFFMRGCGNCHKDIGQKSRIEKPDFTVKIIMQLNADGS